MSVFEWSSFYLAQELSAWAQGAKQKGQISYSPVSLVRLPHTEDKYGLNGSVLGIRVPTSDLGTHPLQIREDCLIQKSADGPRMVCLLPCLSPERCWWAWQSYLCCGPHTGECRWPICRCCGCHRDRLHTPKGGDQRASQPGAGFGQTVSGPRRCRTGSVAHTVATPHLLVRQQRGEPGVQCSHLPASSPEQGDVAFCFLPWVCLLSHLRLP